MGFCMLQNVTEMAEIIAGIQGNDPVLQFQAAQQCRILLSREHQPPIDDILRYGVLPKLITYLNCNDR